MKLPHSLRSSDESLPSAARPARDATDTQFGARHQRASQAFIARVLREVPADLVQASLFGSRARGDAHRHSDVDILLIFRHLPPDREPHATIAEEIADQVAARTGVPVTTWSVSLVDLRRGSRTPMLVDALADSRVLWSVARPLDPVGFTPDDALWCVDRLLERVQEGGYEVARLLDQGDGPAAARRGRDDVVRLCTALLLLRGITRPRRAEAPRVIRESDVLPRALDRMLEWAASSFGADGRDEEATVQAPPGGLPALRSAINQLRQRVDEASHMLQRRRTTSVGRHPPCT